MATMDFTTKPLALVLMWELRDYVGMKSPLQQGNPHAQAEKAK